MNDSSDRKASVVETIKQQWSELLANPRTRTLIIAGAVLLFLGLVYRGGLVYEEMSGEQAGVAAIEKRVAKYRRIVAGKAALEARLAALESKGRQAEKDLLTGKTDALAAVDVQNILNEIAVASGVEIKRMQVLKSDPSHPEDDPYISVPVQFSVIVTIGQLLDMLYKIETRADFFLTVQWIRINTAGTGGDGKIRCDMVVAGIMKNISE